MSTDYLPRHPIPFEQVKGIKLETVKEHITENTTPDNCCLTDGDNHLWFQKSASGFTTFTRFGSNSVEDILDALAEHFNTEFVSEYDEDWEELCNSELYKDDYIHIPLPTSDNPGPWEQIYP